MPGRQSKTGANRRSKFTSGQSLGKSLQRDRVKRSTKLRKNRHMNALGGMHTSELDADAGSITQTNSLADFLATAAMAERDFRAERFVYVLVLHKIHILPTFAVTSPTCGRRCCCFVRFLNFTASLLLG